MDTDTRATIALFVSVGGLLVSGAGFVLNAFRDRPRLTVSSNLWHDDVGNPCKFHVSVVNKGRRPVILKMLGGNSRTGGWGGTYFASTKGGIRLGEHEHYEFEIDKEGGILLDESGPGGPYDVMWIQDTLGDRHDIPNTREYIEQLYPDSPGQE